MIDWQAEQSRLDNYRDDRFPVTRDEKARYKEAQARELNREAQRTPFRLKDYCADRGSKKPGAKGGIK